MLATFPVVRCMLSSPQRALGNASMLTPYPADKSIDPMASGTNPLAAYRAAVAHLCEAHGVRRLELFGSALRADFDTEHSDADFVVEFQPGRGQGFSNFLEFKEALENVLARPVDLIELHAVTNRRLRHHIEQTKAPFYVAA